MIGAAGRNVADGVQACNGEDMESVNARPIRRDALAATVEFARRQPGKALALVLGLHVLIWTVIPLLICPNLQLDLVEDLALGKEWQLGYWKHPPLPWWVADIAYRLTGQIDAVYVLGPLAVVVCFYATWRLARETIGPVAGLIATLALEGVHYYNFSAVKFAHDQMQLPFWAFTGWFFYRGLKRGRALDLAVGGRFPCRRVLVEICGLRAGGDACSAAARRSGGAAGMAHPRPLSDGGGLRGRDRAQFVVARRTRFPAVSIRRCACASCGALDPISDLSAAMGGDSGARSLPAAGLIALLCAGAGAREEPISPPIAADAAFGRRYVTWLALGPFLATTLVATALGRLVIAMWGYPLWPFAPLAALMWLQPVADERALRRFAVGFMAVFVAVPLIYAAVELGEPFVRDRPKATQFPGPAIGGYCHPRMARPLRRATDLCGGHRICGE